LAIGESVPFLDQPSIHIRTAHAADGDDALVAINVRRFAGDRAGSNEIGERKRRLLTAAIVGAAPVPAKLRRLGCVDRVEANALAVDLDGIGINDARPADEVVRRCGQKGKKQEKNEQNERLEHKLTPFLENAA
jgi:hypothetical protein